MGQRLQQAHEAGKAAAWTDCEVVIARVEGDLAAARQAIQQERAARERLEQEMKRAFMRGVCTLNIEVRLSAVGLGACCVRMARHRDIIGLAGHLRVGVCMLQKEVGSKTLWSRCGCAVGRYGGPGAVMPSKAGVAVHSGRGLCMLNIRVGVQHWSSGRPSNTHLGRVPGPLRLVLGQIWVIISKARWTSAVTGHDSPAATVAVCPDY